MPKRHPSQNRGGRNPDGSPAKSYNPKRNAGHALSLEVTNTISNLPQIRQCEWSKSHLAEQLWRNYLGLPADCDWSELNLIVRGQIVRD